MGSMLATSDPALLPPGPLTVADLERMPDDGHRYELLDGVLIVTPAPGWSHQMVVGQLFRRLDETAPPAFDVLPAPFAVHPEAGGVTGATPLSEQYTELQPDVLVAAHADFTAKDLPGAPLLAVEVLSPSTRLIDLNLKKAAYERMGAAHFWVVDPDAIQLWAYELDARGAYLLVAHVQGNDEFVAIRPFAVRLRPSDLLHRRSDEPREDPRTPARNTELST